MKLTALWRHLLFVEVVIYFELEPEYLCKTVRGDTFNIGDLFFQLFVCLHFQNRKLILRSFKQKKKMCM